MSILNRKAAAGPTYSADGCLEGGLAALEQLGRVIEGEGVDEPTGDDTLERTDSVSTSIPPGPKAGLAREESVQESAGTASTGTAASAALSESSAVPPPPSDTDAARLKDVMLADPRLRRLANEARAPSDTTSDSIAAVASASMVSEDGGERRIQSERQAGALGDRLKDRYAVAGVMQTVMVRCSLQHVGPD